MGECYCAGCTAQAEYELMRDNGGWPGWDAPSARQKTNRGFPTGNETESTRQSRPHDEALRRKQVKEAAVSKIRADVYKRLGLTPKVSKMAVTAAMDRIVAKTAALSPEAHQIMTRLGLTDSRAGVWRGPCPK